MPRQALLPAMVLALMLAPAPARTQAEVAEQPRPQSDLRGDRAVAGFEGVEQARIDRQGGMPRLLVNDKPVVPLVFFHNTDIPGPKSARYLTEQVTLAAEHGVHIYSLPFRHHRAADGVTPDYERSNRLLDAFIEADPQAVFILRVYPGPDWSWKEWKTIPDTEFEVFADGTRSKMLSIASEWAWGPSDEDLARMIRHYEASEYGKRILCYQPGGPSHEMFPLYYREKGPDYSQASRRGFCGWLKARYGTDAALRTAWGRPDVSFATAAVPRFEPGRFPMHGVRGDQTAQVFYDLPGDQDWVDYSTFISDITAERIVDWAKLVKRETGHRKLTCFFYGYTFELPGSFSGHYRLRRVLACPEVDMLASPYSYRERFAGGAGNFMSLVDTVTAHGKLWMNEDDTRTDLIDMSQVPESFALFSRKAQDRHETLNILERNFGQLLVHRAGTWWMDLAAAGAFNDAGLWERLAELRPLYEALYRDPRPYRPEVAVVVHEDSKLYVKSDWDANYWTMYNLRDELAKSGASVGYYSLDDFVSGVLPAHKVYVFANAFRLTDEEIRSVHSRLEAEARTSGVTAIWAYAPGYLGPGGPDVARASALVGMKLAVKDSMGGSEGLGPLAGQTWGPTPSLSPRLVVADRSATPLGRYRADGGISSAETRVGRRRSVFLGDLGVSATVLRRLIESAGAHLWTRGGKVVQTDGEVLMVHSGEAGAKRIWLPPGLELEPIKGTTDRLGEIEKREGNTAVVRFEAGDTLWFRLVRKGGDR